jgi:hypothetical protein
MQERAGPCVGWYTTEAGALHRLVNLWRFESFEQRLEARRDLTGDPRWGALMAEVSPLVLDIQSNLLLPTPTWAKTPLGRAALNGDTP